MIDADVAKAWELLGHKVREIDDPVSSKSAPRRIWVYGPGYGRRILDPTEHPEAWLRALLADGRIIQIRPCGDRHLHFEIDGHEWAEYLGYENLGPATEAAIRAWAKVATQ